MLWMCFSITEVDALRYIKDTVHMKQLLMRCDTIHPYYDAVRCDFDSIQHNVIQCNSMQWKKYDAMQFNMVQIVCFYFLGSDRQEIINELKCLLTPNTSVLGVRKEKRKNEREKKKNLRNSLERSNQYI